MSVFLLPLLCSLLCSGIVNGDSRLEEKTPRFRNKHRDPRIPTPSASSVRPLIGTVTPPVTQKSSMLQYRYVPVKNYRALEKPVVRGREVVWSEWVDLPNPLMKNWHLVLKHVSYTDGVLTIHLPEGSSKTIDGLRSHHDLRIVHTPLALSSSTTVESRNVMYVFPGNQRNNFIANAGHFGINVLNPLFRYLFFVHNKLNDLNDESQIPNNQLPLANTLMLLKQEGEIYKNPVFLFDVVLRFTSSYMQYNDYFRSIKSGSTHCFDNIDVPIYDPINHQHPDQPSKEKIMYGRWDTMTYSHKGRWGKTDFYYNFWRQVKKQIWQLYDMDIPVLTGQGLAASVADADADVDAADGSGQVTLRPKLGFMARRGARSPRFDGDISKVGNILMKRFEVTNFNGFFYQWHGDNDTLRYESTRNTLLRVQETDIMLGQAGSNNALSLFMQENKMLVEMKNYNYCANDVSKNLANHNRLAYHALFLSHMGTMKKGQTMQYAPAMLNKLSGEMLAAWKHNVDHFQHASREDAWPSTCDFLWPHEDPAIVQGRRLMTRSNMSRCYLERIPRLGWYQLGVHQNDFDCLNPNSTVHDSNKTVVVVLCMISGLC